jgi:hypothetical protein
MFLAISAFLLLAAGATSLYLATAHQRLLARPPATPVLRVAGFGSLAAALAALLMLMGPATAVFTWTIGVMLAWTLPPVVIGWLRYRKEGSS